MFLFVGILPEVSAVNNFRDLLDEARDYHLMPERRPLLQSFRSRPRFCNYVMGHIFAVGGLTKSGNVGYSLLTF
jgi:kelch-like protein 18